MCTCLYGINGVALLIRTQNGTRTCNNSVSARYKN